MIAVREARASEWQLWRDLRLRALADAPDAYAQELPRARAHSDAEWQAHVAPRPDRIALIDERDGAAVGMAVAVVGDDRRSASLYAMWVAPEARRAGIGRRLIEAAIGWARPRALSAIDLQV